MVKPIVLVGGGGHARVVLDICRVLRLQVAGVLDKSPSMLNLINDAETLGDDSLIDDTAFVAAHRFVVAIGAPAARKNLASRIASSGGRFATLIHPAAVIGSRVTFGEGTVVMAGVVINCDVAIGRHAIVNTRASLDHDCHLENGVHICPGATLAGSVSIGAWSTIGAGTTIINNRKIGEAVFVGAGTVVVKDLPDHVLARGVPCQIVGSA